MKQSALFIYNGYDIHTDSSMTVDGEPYQVRRSWKARLFTRPWQPLKGTKTVVPQVPSREVLKFDNKLIMHPETERALRGCMLREVNRLIDGPPQIMPRGIK